MSANDLEVEFRVLHREVFIGARDKEYDTKSEALASLVREKLAATIADAGGVNYDFDSDDAAQAIIDAKADVIRWLSALSAE